MKFNRLSTALIIRSILLALTSILFGYLSITLIDKKLFFIPFLIIIIIIAQIVEIVFFIKNYSSKILEYVKIIKSVDFSGSDSIKNTYGSLEQVQESVNDLIKLVQKSKFEKELQKQYLNLIVDYINIGLISFNQNMEVISLNKTAKQVLKIHNFKNLNDLKMSNKVFYNEIMKLKSEESKLLNVVINSENIILTISKSIFKIGNEVITNITFQDIRNEIVQSEIDSWQKLIKVLRHEILNSVTPISTLTETVLSIVENDKGEKKQLNELNNEDLEDIQESMKSIKTRSDGLYNFVNIYREIGKLPQPKFEYISITQVIDSLEPLINKSLQDRNIKFTKIIKNENLLINADFSLVQQVLINLIKNSIEALENIQNPKIEILAHKINSKIEILVKDNGIGIPKNQLDEIFIPLFTTKEKGFGIGLFLSRQIMQLHNGSITVNSLQNVKTIFTLSFIH